MREYKPYPIKIDGSNWTGIETDNALNFEARVAAVLDVIVQPTDGVGQTIFRALPAEKTIVIVPFDDNSVCNANASEATIFERGQARVRFDPVMWAAGSACSVSNVGPGSAQDEILLHELLHALRRVRGSYDRQPFNVAPDKLFDTNEELFSILITNVYMSEKVRPSLRRDHSGFTPLPAKWATSEGFVADSDFSGWIQKFWSADKVFIESIGRLALPAFNPLRAFKPAPPIPVPALAR
jgi:hypothetical protein